MGCLAANVPAVRLATLVTMTAREELHALVDRVPEEELPAALERLRAYALAHPDCVGPQSLGMGHSGYSDISARADELLRETGFGE